MDPRDYYRPLSRDEKARLVRVAERLELASKKKGKRAGVLGLSGLHLLRVLLYQALGKDGRLDLSYRRMMELSGLARATVSRALSALERIGLLTVVRRLCRRRIARINPVTGDPETITTTTQATSLYAFKVPTSRFIPLPAKPSSLNGRKSHDRGLQEGGGNGRNTFISPGEALRLEALGDIAGVMMKRLRANEPDWRLSARRMTSRAG